MIKIAAIARGEIPADVVIHDVRIANIFTQEYERGDIAIYGNRIAGVGGEYSGRRVFEGSGRTMIPGLIDGHVHIEDTMLTPQSFARSASLHGTTSIEKGGSGTPHASKFF